MISGKGGTGKTSITGCFASLARNSVLADCDVDAANLHLILHPDIKKTIGFHGLDIASVDSDKCKRCGECVKHCQFDAIDENINIIKSNCEGCGVCELVCPHDAISMVKRNSGFLYISDTRFGPMVHARLTPGEEASGKLITLVRKNANKIAVDTNKDYVIVDGPPGIGCPVISSITGVDMVLAVTEPTMSAVHDLERVLGVAIHFQIPAMVCINKYDLNKENTQKIEQYCTKQDIPVIGKIKYDKVFTDAMVDGRNVVEYSPDCEVSIKIKKMWDEVKKNLEK